MPILSNKDQPIKTTNMDDNHKKFSINLGLSDKNIDPFKPILSNMILGPKI